MCKSIVGLSIGLKEGLGGIHPRDVSGLNSQDNSQCKISQQNTDLAGQACKTLLCRTGTWQNTFLLHGNFHSQNGEIKSADLCSTRMSCIAGLTFNLETSHAYENATQTFLVVDVQFNFWFLFNNHACSVVLDT